MSDAREIIFTELSERVQGPKAVAGDAYMIVCPFHGDSDPSLGVNLTTDTEIPLGFFHCFGCGAKGGWNVLAEKLDLQQIKGWELGFVGHGTKRESRRRRDVHYKNTEQELQKALFTREYIDWPAEVEWRGYSGKIINKLGGIYYNDHLTKELMLFFPIKVNGVYKGGVRAYLEKQVGGNSYLTTKGKWAKSYGLLGYEYVKNIIRKYGYNALVVVEGPRDELRLISNNIPALGVLGVEVISKKKIMRILAISKNIETIYVMPDNDNAGTILFKHVRAIAGDLVKVKHLKLPRNKDKDGKLIKMDPDDCDQSIIDEVHHLLNSHRIKTAQKQK